MDQKKTRKTPIIKSLNIYIIRHILSFFLLRINISSHETYLRKKELNYCILNTKDGHNPEIEIKDLYLKYGNFHTKIFFAFQTININIRRVFDFDTVYFNILLSMLNTDIYNVEKLLSKGSDVKFEILYIFDKNENYMNYIKQLEKISKSKNFCIGCKSETGFTIKNVI